MPEWVQLANTAGVAIACLVAIGIAAWKFGKLVCRKFLGDETHEGLIDTWYKDERKRWDAMMDLVHQQQLLCTSHGTSVTTTKQEIDKLLALHIDPSIQGSTAEAIECIHKLREAALQTCVMGRAVANKPEQMAEIVCQHCDEIEAKLRAKA